ncbi:MULTISPECIES: YceI family protein [Rubrivivax]|uniref:Polyisoprenoid-binding protein n=1 Tax=Rubrivivax benzoatilyticus TaxID=316997 RepID=A0ABX0HV99_9BURK|nr:MULTISPECIES: YceI family protein [Rubrivivax]EGJ11707.1 YceI family protein [Rubrivivax benzoatilyticus JA2 = ATCC BAA-35]MCD0422871.1 YceI family protein [Rubrivivax sp. JA1024]NHK98946.1 polyisoprenoid-binding protein [Rubrivivax benzoatilyticus]NHL24449.1 polyisoprenoid-binding protein [Rubrivivax benzoatilyticus]
MKTFATAALLAAAAFAAQAEPVTYKVDATHAAAFYEIGHFATSTNRGRFPVKEGSVTIDRAAKAGKVDITLDMAGVNSGVAAMDKHLRGSDFFSTDQYPTARFVADRFEFKGDKVEKVHGSLTMLGKTHPVTLEAERFNCYQNPMLKREVCGGDFETTIKRSLWGVNYGLEYGFADEVEMQIQVEAVRQ